MVVGTEEDHEDADSYVAEPDQRAQFLLGQSFPLVLLLFP